jgi:hypothetical protein
MEMRETIHGCFSNDVRHTAKTLPRLELRPEIIEFLVDRYLPEGDATKEFVSQARLDQNARDLGP